MIPTVGGALNAGISSLLNGDAALVLLAPGKAWRKVAPPGEDRITVIWNTPPAMDRHTFQGGGYAECMVMVKATKVGRDDDGLHEAYARVHALIDGLTTSGGVTVKGVMRVNEFSFDEERGEFTAWHVGGEYRVMLCAA